MSTTGQNTTTDNTNTFVSALVLGLIVAGVYVTLFLVLHGRSERVFQPRAIAGSKEKRPPKLPVSVFQWFSAIIRTPDTEVCRLNGLDAYFFIRFIRIVTLLLIPYWLLTWAVLMPIAAVGPNKGQPGLNMFTYGNVMVQSRLIAFIVIAIVLMLFTIHIIYREYNYYYQFRTRYLGSAEYAALSRSKNVLIANLPASWDTKEHITEFVKSMEVGVVRDVWLVYDTKALDKEWDKRNTEVTTLEKGIVNAEKVAAKNVKENTLPEGSDKEEANPDPVVKYIDAKKRPTHKLGFLGLIGKKVDSLEYGPKVITEHNEKLHSLRENWQASKRAPAAFVRFEDATAAETFARDACKHFKIRTLIARADVVPEDIIWSNLSMSPYMRWIRSLISWGLTAFLIIIWAPLVAFVGVVSNVSNLCSTVSFLAWICKLPSAVVGIIQGILPPVLLAVLFMLLPIFLRIFVKIQGEPRHSTVELKLWSRFWIFNIIHGFLIVAIASGLLSALKNISQTVPELPQNLASSLPSSSIFFLTYILTATLGSTTSATSRAVPFVMTKLAFILRGGIPRKAFAYDYGFGSIALATAWPPVALLAVIAITYTAAQPIIIGFAAVGFMLTYLLYKYLLIWVVEQPAWLETGGKYYVSALGALFAGLYVEEVFMAALFFLQKSTTGYVGGALFAATLVGTVVTHMACLRIAARAVYPPQHFIDKLKEDKQSIAADILAGCETDTRLSSRGDVHMFDPPSTWRDPIVWVPEDAQGIGRSEAEKLSASGIPAIATRSTLTPEGRTEVEEETEGFPDGEI